jgi:hypothetical protein
MLSFNLKLALLGLVSASASITVSGCASSRDRAEDSTATAEVEVTMAQLPPAVRQTLEREAAGGEVEEIELETKADGVITYSADTKIGGKIYDITIAQDGTLISRELD